MRPLVNRWLIISEPLFDEAEVPADLADLPKFSAGKQKSSKVIKGTCQRIVVRQKMTSKD